MFFYHAPEAVTFFHGEHYSQYFKVLYYNDAVGKAQLDRLRAGAPDIVLMSASMAEEARPFLAKYREDRTLDHGNYLIFERK